MTIQNIHGVNYLYVADQQGMALSDGIQIRPGGAFSVKKALGEEPEKAWYVVASGANTTARIFVDYGDYPFVVTNIQPTPDIPPYPPYPPYPPIPPQPDPTGWF